MRFRFWPNTLAVQLIVVVAAAVAVSNLAVAFYFYKKSEEQSRNVSDERMIDPVLKESAIRETGE